MKKDRGLGTRVFKEELVLFLTSLLGGNISDLELMFASFRCRSWIEEIDGENLSRTVSFCVPPGVMSFC